MYVLISFGIVFSIIKLSKTEIILTSPNIEVNDIINYVVFIFGFIILLISIIKKKDSTKFFKKKEIKPEKLLNDSKNQSDDEEPKPADLKVSNMKHKYFNIENKNIAKINENQKECKESKNGKAVNKKNRKKREKVKDQIPKENLYDKNWKNDINRINKIDEKEIDSCEKYNKNEIEEKDNDFKIEPSKDQNQITQNDKKNKESPTERHESKNNNENDINETLNITNSIIKEKSLDESDENFKMNDKTHSDCQVSQKENNFLIPMPDAKNSVPYQILV